MILQALYHQYHSLLKRGEIEPPGWSRTGVSFALDIGDDGSLKHVVSVKTEQARGRNAVLAPQSMKIPAQVKRTSGVSSNFLCDNSGFILGVDAKNKPVRTAECFTACRELHERLLEGVDSPAAKAVLRFFRKWRPERSAQNPALREHWEDLMSGANLVFLHRGKFAQDDEEIAKAWEHRYMSDEGAIQMPCIITGEYGPVEAVHPAIKGIAGAKSSGAALVSFNAPAFRSYGKKQSLNAPTGRMAAFAYTSALNHMIADRAHVSRIGDTTVLFWADGAEPAYQGLFSLAFLEVNKTYSERDLRDKVYKLTKGDPVDFDDTRLDPNRRFYVLGIAPNASRLSVRFFLENSFGEILKNAAEHQRRLEIVRPNYDSYETIPLWKLLRATVNMNARDKSPAPNLAGEMLRAILMDTYYPATLLNGVMLRIRAEREMTRERAAIIKAYYLKNKNKSVPEEVLTVRLNRESECIPYNLGRLFSVLEEIQSAANPGVRTTIRDRYFTSAAATPCIVFPTLVNLTQKHLKKLSSDKPGWAVVLEKKLTDIMDRLEEEYPVRLTLPEQGAFQLGYYHQTADRYRKKEETENA